MSVEITDLTSGRQVDRDLIIAAAEATLGLAARQLDELSIVLLDDEGMTRLNLRLLDRDEPTDVIAFEAEEDPDARQAAEYGHTPAEELAFLVAHGVLHALAYDDAEDADRAAMFALQEQVLAVLREVGL